MVGSELVEQEFFPGGQEFGDLLVGGDGGEGVVGDLPAEAEGAFDGDAEEPEALVGEDLGAGAFLEGAVEAG